MHFPVVIHKEKSSTYGVTVPDLPGCFSAGSTMEAALTNAVEAIECHLEGMLFDGESIPEAKSVEVHQRDSQFNGGTWALVNVDLSKLASKAKRINITLPERVLALVDEQAKRWLAWVRDLSRITIRSYTVIDAPVGAPCRRELFIYCSRASPLPREGCGDIIGWIVCNNGVRAHLALIQVENVL